MEEQVDTRRKMAPEHTGTTTMDAHTPTSVTPLQRRTMTAGSFREDQTPTTTETQSDDGMTTDSADGEMVHRWQPGDRLEKTSRHGRNWDVVSAAVWG